MRRLAALLTLLAGLAACGEAPPAAPPVDAGVNAEALSAWFEAKYEEQLERSPISLTFLGRKDRQGEIDDLSLAAEEAELAWLAGTVEDLKANFDYDTLPQHLKDSWDLWVYQYERARDGAAFRLADYQFDQMNGAQSFLPTLLISFHTVASPLDLEGLIARYREGGRALKDEQISEEDARRYRQEARLALTEGLAPAYARLLAWARSELPEDEGPVTGLSNRKDDGAYYNYLLRRHTTTDLTADEIHEIGLAEVARLRGEMEVIKERVGFEGDLRAFFDMLRGATRDERFYFPNTDEGRQAYLDEATAAIERIKARLPDYFGILPKADLVVRRVEPFREQDGAAQHYYPAALDGSRPGIYYAHLSDMNAMPKHELEVIAYHEGLPGHHMQIAIAQELEGIPTFRTQTNFNAYAEGWGLYAEWLATEIDGTYLDPYSEFGRLGSEMWRAIRLVVDTGLHAKGWTEEEANAYFLDNGPITEAQARSEVRRYIVMPGQATGYKIGMLRIQALRRKAEAALGDAFDIRAFHDTILGGGAMPLTLLEARVDRWITETQGSDA
ncbi:MAG: DUF885 domain-containing protein [Gammaproteobacteria bacterium]|nr:DUF885 domain-containing protein [Gammaproteobacteria bacterium]